KSIFLLLSLSLFLPLISFSTTTYTVGAAGSYTTIASAYAACTGSTDYVIEIRSDYSLESLPISLGTLSNKSLVNTVTIRPQTAVSPTWSTSNGTSIFTLNGADYVIFDGRAGGSGSSVWSIQNTSTGSGADVFLIQSDARYNTIKYLTLKGSGTGTGAPIGFGSSASGGNTNNTISNNNITKSTGGTPAYGIYSYGSSVANNNSSTTISDNNFYDLGEGDWCAPVSYSDNWTITNNSFYQTANITLSSTDLNMIYIGANNVDATITGNYFGGRSSSCGGSAFTITTGSYKLTCISFNSITGNVSLLSNTFANFTATSTGSNSITCIDTYNTAVYTIGSLGNGNTFGSTSSNGSITINGSTGSTKFYAISHFATNASNSISYNTFAGITQNHTTASTFPIFYGIYASLSSNASISYNTFGATNGAIQLTGTSVGVGYEVISWNSNNNASITYNTFQNFNVSNAASTNDNSILYFSGTGTSTITNNTLGSTTTNNMAFSTIDQVNAIHDYSDGNSTISNNTIQQFNITGTGTSTGFYGINIDFSSAIKTISSNTIKNITTAATGIYAFTGIHLESSNVSNTNSISQNTIKTISASSSTAATVIGIYNYDGGGTVQKNRLSDFTFNSSNASANLFGILVDADNDLNFYNNVVLFDNGSASPIIRGILNRSGTSNTFNFYQNTVKIYGTATSGSNNSNAFTDLNSAGSTINVKNNIFQNTRSNSGGSGTHLSIRFGSSSPTIASDYNYLEASGSGGKIGNWNGTEYTTIALFRTASSKDANSKNGTITIGSLGSVTANASGNVQNTGTDMDAIVPTDLDGTARHATTPWIGAFESATALPIELLFFNAKLENNTYVDLIWSTASEINNDYFTIERSQDGLNLQEFDIVAGAGNSTHKINYSLIDRDPFDGISYYRLKQTDYDGKYTYSDIISVNKTNLNSTFTIYPNPNHGNEFAISGNVNWENSKISIYNQSGMLIENVNINDDQLIHPSSNLNSGIYFIKIISNETNTTLKMIVN
ncbi:MAG: T9SS type A sorting domain-containing protein, partial [Fluviicola sp.]|nr:T9SS type A sorting domain-containing protein [Fluviicola sp.]